MLTIGTLNALSDTINEFVKAGKTIGFVPTMGALHEGHLALVKESTTNNDVTVVSIFVNPLQFNNPEDLKKYPRVLQDDIKLLAAENVDLIFSPTENELYASKPVISMDFGHLSKTLEGAFRPGHFDGVGIVVSKLLNLINPTRAYFGLKDLQQFLLIRKMCEDLSFTNHIIGVETVREKSGLAMSSRNRLLSQSGKEKASSIFKGLELIREGIDKNTPLNQLLSDTREFYSQKDGFELEYLEAVNGKDLSKVEDYKNLDELAVCVAGYVEGVRLIDNLYLRLK